MKLYFDSSSKTIRNIVVLLLFLWLTELHSLLWHLAPKFMNQPFDLFIQPGYHRVDISLEWWCKTTFDDLLFCSALIMASKYVMNRKIAIVLRWIGIYYVLDFAAFLWNYKSSFEYFYSLLGVTTVIFILLLAKHKQKRGLIIDIEKGTDYEKED